MCSVDTVCSVVHSTTWFSRFRESNPVLQEDLLVYLSAGAWLL